MAIQIPDSREQRAGGEICAPYSRPLISSPTTLKFVVIDPAELDEVADLVRAHSLGEVWVMPEGTDPETVLHRLRLLAGPASRHGFHLTPRLHILLWGTTVGGDDTAGKRRFRIACTKGRTLSRHST